MMTLRILLLALRAANGGLVIYPLSRAVAMQERLEVGHGAEGGEFGAYRRLTGALYTS